MSDNTPTRVIDPVCGKTIDRTTADGRGLTLEHDGATYYFCARGCMLDFADDPKQSLDRRDASVT